MAMTEEERRQARNEASRRWYLAHKGAKSAQNKSGGAKPNAKKVELKQAQPNAGVSKLEKQVDKFVDKAVKTADLYKALVKDAAQVLADVYKAGDEKLVAKACKAFGKRLSLEVVPSPEEGRAELKPSVGAKVFRIPKTKPAVQPTAKTEETEEEDADPKEKVVSVDPSVLTGIEDGSVTTADVDAADESECDDDDDKTDAQRLAELREMEEDELSDAQREEMTELEEIEQEMNDADGTAEAMRELEAQGAYDD